MAGVTEYEFKIGDRVDAIGGTIFRNGVIKGMHIERSGQFQRVMYDVVFDGYLWQKRSYNSIEPAKNYKV